jgi:hypothetical protein
VFFYVKPVVLTAENIKTAIICDVSSIFNGCHNFRLKTDEAGTSETFVTIHQRREHGVTFQKSESFKNCLFSTKCYLSKICILF